MKIVAFSLSATYVCASMDPKDNHLLLLALGVSGEAESIQLLYGRRILRSWSNQRSFVPDWKLFFGLSTVFMAASCNTNQKNEKMQIKMIKCFAGNLSSAQIAECR